MGLHKWPKSHPFLESVNHHEWACRFALGGIDGNAPGVNFSVFWGAVLAGGSQVADRAWVYKATEIPGGRQLHTISVTCEACGRGSNRQWRLGYTSSLA